MRVTSSMLAVAIACALVHGAAAQAPASVAGSQLETPPQDLRAYVTSVLRDAEAATSEAKWDEAIVLLTGLIDRLATALDDPFARESQVTALERRALARLSRSGDKANARSDFDALLRIEPNHVLTSNTSEAIRSFFEAIRKETLSTIEVELSPPDARLQATSAGGGVAGVESRQTWSAGLRWIRPGTYTLEASKIGFEPFVTELVVPARAARRLPVKLRRASAVVEIVASEPGIRISLDEAVVGTTAPRPDDTARMLPVTLANLTPRSQPYNIRLEKECRIPARYTFRVERVDEETLRVTTADRETALDVNLTPTLRHARGTIQVEADGPVGDVIIDRERAGTSKEPHPGLCEGAHDVEFRSELGRSSHRVTVSPDATTTVRAQPVLTYALVAESAVAVEAIRLNTSSLQFTAVADASESSELQAATPEAANRATALIKQTQSQGIAIAARTPADQDRNDVQLILRAIGSMRPDVVRWSSTNADSVKATSERLQRPTAVTTRSLGIEVIDLRQRSGAHVVAVTPGGPSADMKPGDVIIAVGQVPVNSSGELMRELARSATSQVNIQVRSGDATRYVTVSAAERPSLPLDDGWLPNVAITELRARLIRQASGQSVSSAEREGVRLRLASALMAVEAWEQAYGELSTVEIGGGAGVSRGTVEYLKGVCLIRAGRAQDARPHLEQAAKEPDATLYENGPLVAYLASAELGTAK